MGGICGGFAFLRHSLETGLEKASESREGTMWRRDLMESGWWESRQELTVKVCTREEGEDLSEDGAAGRKGVDDLKN